MNKSESQAVQWLIKNKGLRADEIKKSKKTPDFLTPLGGYEVKKLYGDKVLFYHGQLEQLKRFPGVKILIFDGNGEMVKEASYSDINLKEKTIADYKIITTEMVTIQVEKEVVEMLKARGRMGDTYSAVIRRLLDGQNPEGKREPERDV